jgi:hypothetical protein
MEHIVRKRLTVSVFAQKCDQKEVFVTGVTRVEQLSLS